MKHYDVIVIGAGAAGLSAAATAIARGRRVAIFEMGNSPARKVMISGGGRCNITNLAADYTRYFGKNPNFVRSAISRVSPHDIISWANEHKINLVEKNTGQFFAATGAADVVAALMHDVQNADIFYNTEIRQIERNNNGFIVNGIHAESVVVATGGISFDSIGVSDSGYKIAKEFGHKIVPVRPALCAMSIAGANAEMAGISVPAQIRIGRTCISDSLLFTHFGIGGPAVYRASLHDITDGIYINLMPGVDVVELLKKAKRENGKKSLTRILGQYLPNKLAGAIVGTNTRNIADFKDSEIINIAKRLTDIFIPANQIKLHGMRSAEVVRGGVDTDSVSSKTMESKLCPGLFWAGEVIDVAGDLGGFNLHWAWASGRVAGQNA